MEIMNNFGNSKKDENRSKYDAYMSEKIRIFDDQVENMKNQLTSKNDPKQQTAQNEIILDLTLVSMSKTTVEGCKVHENEDDYMKGKMPTNVC